MRVSGARPKRTCSAVVSSSASVSAAKVMPMARSKLRGLVVDLGGVAGNRDEITAVVAEIDVALDQAQFLILRTLA